MAKNPHPNKPPIYITFEWRKVTDGLQPWKIMRTRQLGLLENKGLKTG